MRSRTWGGGSLINLTIRTGHGVPIAFGAGKAIAQMIKGQEPKLPDSFSPKRLGNFGSQRRNLIRNSLLTKIG
ncbi:MAG TPA: hypothetical protein V6C84_30140 [Coleofasciculaceae cyanobacterium]|jgi:glycine/D-amino acid oxidase-like deaminating enzyme